MWLPVIACQHRRLLRLGDDDFDVGTSDLQDFTSAGERASCAPTGYPVVETISREIAQDLGTCGVAVVVWVRWVIELLCKKPAVLLREFLGPLHHAGAALCCWREDYLTTEGAHDLASFDGECFHHSGDEGMPRGSANHGECDAGIP